MRKVRSETVPGFIESLVERNDSGTAINQSSARAKRIAEIIEEYDSQGFHRTGTAVDRVSALWLAGHIEQLGFEPILEKFPLSRVDPIQAYIQIDKRRVEGVPLFDGRFTDGSGIKGTLGWLGTDADIAVTQISPASDTEDDKQIQAYRRSGRYKGIIAITRGLRSGLALVNAPNFTSPFGPPVLQVPSEEARWLEEAAKQGKDVVLVAQVQRTEVDAWNVIATVKGKASNLAPLIVMTPRSGWWHCAGERGGGLVCWLEIMRTLSAKQPARDVVFVATSGHELSELGLKFFLKQRPSLAKTARVWLHFGANIGAAVGRSSMLFAATEDYQNQAIAAMSQTGAPLDERYPVGSTPLGEALLIHQKGGHYISLLGRNHLFHHPEDRWSSAVDVDNVTRLATAFVNLATMLAGESDRFSASD